jgi:PAS domain S-box-containing protein
MPTILRYGIAVLSVAIAIGLCFFLLQYFDAKLTPFLFAVAATVWYAGTGPGVLAIVLSVLSLNDFFLQPFSFNPISYADLVYLTFCTICALAVGWVSTVRRRTEQELRQAREELEAKVVERTADLQRSERYLTETQKLTHTGSWAWDARSQKVLYCSEEMFRIYGLDPQKDLPTRKNFRQRVHPEDRDRTDARFARVVNEKVDSFDEYRVLLPDGTVKHVISSGHPVLDENGELIEFIGTATDVTERKRAEEALRDSEAKIRRLVDSNIIGIFITGLEGRVLEANDAFVHLVGHDRDDLVSGRIRWTDLTPPEWRERDKRALAELTSNTIAQPYEKEFFRKDGSRVPVLIGGTLFEEGGDEGVAFVLDLTERKRAEEALRESEHKLRQIIDTIPAHVVRYQPDGAADFMNQTFSEFVGSGVGFDNLSSVVHPEDYPERSRDWDTHVAAAEPYDIEMRLRRADGVYRWRRSRRVPLRDANGAIVNWYGAGHDIDDQKRAEQALRHSEAYLSEAQRLSHTGTWAWDARSQKVLYCSEEMFRIYGLDSQVDLPTRKNFRQRVHPEDRNRVDERQARVVNEKVDSFDEFRIVLPDGTVKHVSSTWHTFLDGNRELIELIGTATDITERKCAEEALRASERSARSALHGIAGLVAIMTPNGEVETVNRQCVEYFGRPVEEQKDWVTTDMVHPEDLPHMLENFKRAIASEIPYHFEQRLRRFDGEYRWFETRGGAVRDDTGSIVRWYVLLPDIEDRIRALARLAQAQLELAHANRVATMGQLTASIAHEVSQPITAAVTYASAARRFLSVCPGRS